MPTATLEKSAPTVPDALLGGLACAIVGAAYHDGEVKPGEVVTLERDPANPHDPNAVRVLSADFEIVGHLPRQVVAWLAPLVDAGKVRAEAKVAASWRGADDRSAPIPLTLSLHLAKKGRAILEPIADPPTPELAVHELVRRAFTETEGYTRPGVVAGLAERLATLGRREALPETRLLLALLAARGAGADGRSLDDAAALARAALAGARLGAPQHHRNLTLFPLYIDGGGELSYDLFRDALAGGGVEVREVSEAGSVPNLTLVNRGTKPVLVPEGEILTGAKQNRVVNITVLIAASTTYTLPVSCVESGRWHSVSATFAGGAHAHPALRAAKLASVHAARNAGRGSVSDQGRVWAEVDLASQNLGVRSHTSSLTDVMEGAGERRQPYREAIAIPADACGFVAGSGGRIIGLEAFGAPSVMARLAGSLTDAYFTQASWDARRRRPTTEREARAFLAAVAAGLRTSDQQSSAGVELEIAAPGLTGTALAHAGRLCHVAAFAVGKEDGDRDMRVY
jgi:hypothetical protein